MGCEEAARLDHGDFLMHHTNWVWLLAFAAGCAVQVVMDAALRAAAGRCWVDVAYPAH